MVYPDGCYDNTSCINGVLINPLIEDVVFNYYYLGGYKYCFGYSIYKKNTRINKDEK